jgi:hypothetical protein
MRSFAPLLLLAAALAPLPALTQGARQPATVAIVNVYRDHFEYANGSFPTIDELREALAGKSIGYSVREYGAEAKVGELLLLITERREDRPINILRERFDLRCE